MKSVRVPHPVRFGYLGILLLALAGPLGMTGCASSTPDGPKAAQAYSFWPLFPAEPRIQFVRSFSYIDDIAPRRGSTLENIIYGDETEAELLIVQKPYGVDMFDGKIYVCDIRGPSIVILDLTREEARLMGTSGANRVQRPVDIAIADDGMTYVADLARGIVFVFDQNERQVAMFGHQGFKPVSVAVFGDELIVSDFESQQVLVLNRFDGSELRRIGEAGDAEGQFVRPIGVAVDDDGNVYVSDAIACRVQKFSPEGEFVGSHGEISDLIGSFVRPKHVAVDAEENYYVVDSAFQNVQIFNRDDQLLTFFGAAGDHPGSMALPAGIAVYEGDSSVFEPYIHPAFRADRLVLVTNQFGRNKVAVYAIGQLREGYTPQDIVQSSVAVAGTVEGGGDQPGQLPEDTEYDVEPGEGEDEPLDDSGAPADTSGG